MHEKIPGGSRIKAVEEQPLRFLNPRTFLNVADSFFKGDVYVEIGFGRGEFLEELGKRGWKVLGIEVSNEGIEKALKRVGGMKNVLVVKGEGFFFLKYLTPPNSLKGVFTIFPDPFIKHEHKRLINRKFLQVLAEKLKLGGFFYFITDWDDYYLQVKGLISEFREFARRDKSFPLDTRFFRKWRRKGRNFYEIYLEKIEEVNSEFSWPERDFSLKVDAKREPEAFLEVSNGWVFKVEEVFKGKGGFILRTLVKEPEAPELKQFIYLKGNRLGLFVTGHEIAAEPIKALIKRIKERLEHGESNKWP